MKILIINFIIKPISFLLYPLIYVLFSIKHIKIGALSSGRIGLFAILPELYLCEKDYGLHSKETNDIFGYTDVCNKQLLTMFKRVLNIKKYARLLHLLVLYGPNKDKFIIDSKNGNIDRDILGLFDKYPTHISFSTEEEETAGKCLKKMGISNNDPYVCIAARDSRYLQKVKPYKNWSYHDFRNVNINNYSSVTRELISRGNYVIRMGTHIQDIMDLDNKKYIEYYHNGYRTDLMDIYLGANCKFFITSCTGIDAVALLFRRPIVETNCSVIEVIRTCSPNIISIFKKYWLKNEKRFMTFKEIFKSGAGQIMWASEFSKFDIELVENTKDEISEVVKEMDDRLTGTWESNEEDDDLQNRFWSIFPKNNTLPYGPNSREIPLHGKIKSRIGAGFLRQYRNLLE